MIIKSITLNNFRVFRGVHEIDLAPKASSEENTACPIVLFGGLNGAGKTSVLTAVRLALYGRNSIGTNVTNDEYKEYLSSLIHKGKDTPISENAASIELCFEYNHQGETEEYTVIRGWKSGQLDKVQIRQADFLKEELSNDQCQGFLNELIPLGVADLFFFDGEKIAELAEDETGSILRTAVQRLLGLDVIARLRSDLSILLKRNNVKAMPESIKKQITSLEEKQNDFESKADQLENEITGTRTSIISLKTELSQVEQTLSQNGGAWAKSRQEEQSKVDSLLVEKTDLAKTIRQEFESALPISLAPKTLTQLLTLLDKESETKQKQAFKSELSNFIEQASGEFISELENATSALDALKKVANQYSYDENEDNLLFDISDRELNKLHYQVEETASQSKDRFEQAQKRLNEVELELEQASSNIARAPEQDQVQKQLEQIKSLNDKITKILLNRKDLIHKAKRAYRDAADTARQIQKLHNSYKADTNAAESVTNAIKANGLLTDFSESLKLARIEHLQTAFIESYKKLARKEDLKISADINPDTFDVALVDEHGNKINRKALSAGEKQIYAIAILEALAKASGHKLPVIIDTPLGRLDSKHRDKLIKYYFPNASHQVIILSTDTEVDEQYSEWMSDSISHTFEIEFDQDSNSSSLKPGYFWHKNVAEAV